MKEYIPKLLFFGALSFFLCSLAYLGYRMATAPQTATVLPGGNTYLGPSGVTPASQGGSPVPSASIPSMFIAPENATWKTWRGKTYPVSFSYPDSLPVYPFPNDPTEAVGISWAGKRPEEMILMSVMDLSKDSRLKFYVAKPKKEFVAAWWKQFPGLIGVASLEEFTNAKNLKGYKARFTNTKGETPNLDVFFEAPGNQSIVIRIANGIIDPKVFDQIVETVEWTNK